MGKLAHLVGIAFNGCYSCAAQAREYASSEEPDSFLKDRSRARNEFDAWLQPLGLEEYAAAFAERGCVSLILANTFTFQSVT